MTPPCREAGGPLPEPSGPFRVGTAALDAPADLGHLAAFYPTADCAGDRPQYLRAELADALGIDPDALAQIAVHASIGATPLEGAPRPVVVLTPGWTSLVALSTSLAVDLASHGYVVITADPQLGTETTTFPNEADAVRRRTALQGVLDFIHDPAIEPITGPLDRTHIAAGGHSYAGSVAFQVAQIDERLTAVFDLDGVLHGAALTGPMRVPSLIVATADGSATDPSLTTVLAQSPQAIGIAIELAKHYDLTDAPALTETLGPLTRSLARGVIGSIAIETTNQLVRRFLDCVAHDATTTTPCVPSAESIAVGVPHTNPLPSKN